MNSLLVYKLSKSKQKVIFNPLESTGKAFRVEKAFALCYKFTSLWASGDTWRIELSDGYYEKRRDSVNKYKLIRAIWNFNGITTFLNNMDPPDFFQLGWNNVCYEINYVQKTISFYRNGQMVATKIFDVLNKTNGSVNITKITIQKNARGMVSNVNLITNNVTADEMIAFTSCKSYQYEGPSSWMSGAWKLLDENETELAALQIKESSGSTCDQKPYFLMLPSTGFWLGKEKCNLLSGKAYLFRNETERLEFTAWVKAWHKKLGKKKERPILDLTDEEEEGVWVATETGEVIAIDEVFAPGRISEHKYENWRPGQPNGGRSENNVNYDAYHKTRKGWIDGCSWCQRFTLTCQVSVDYFIFITLLSCKRLNSIPSLFLEVYARSLCMTPTTS